MIEQTVYKTQKKHPETGRYYPATATFESIKKVLLAHRRKYLVLDIRIKDDKVYWRKPFNTQKHINIPDRIKEFTPDALIQIGKDLNEMREQKKKMEEEKKGKE